MTSRAVVPVVFASALAIACGGPTSPPGDARPETAAFIEHGAALYEAAGCGICHDDGDETVAVVDAPSLDTMVQRFGIDDGAVDEAVEWIRSGAIHDQSRDDERPFDGFPQFVVAVRLYGELVGGEEHIGFLGNAHLDEPMPRWSETLSRRDVDAIVAYLISESAD